LMDYWVGSQVTSLFVRYRLSVKEVSREFKEKENKYGING
jgi:hypothetical protein